MILLTDEVRPSRRVMTMRTIQLELFNLAGMMEKDNVSVTAYYSEFQSLAIHQRNNAGYGGDLRAEKEVKELTRQGEISYKQWNGKEMTDEACKEALYELIVRLWCVKVNGKVSRDIYQNQRPPKLYTPVFDDNFACRIPPELMKVIPKENVLLVNYEEYEGNQQQCYAVTYFCEDIGVWYSCGILYDNRKSKWLDTRTTRMYSEQLRADRENQWWTRKGYEKAKADNKLDPQIAAVWSNYVKFYGRDEALCRLGLPPVTAGFDERDFEECDKYGWYSKRKAN
jgi:hypothetical protein